MEVLTGELLKQYVSNKLNGIDKKRYCYEALNEYINKQIPEKVCCLYGLRRTGKTILLCQSIHEINVYDKTLMILCEKGDSVQDVRRVIRAHVCKYVFIDEATKMHNFINTSSVFADCFIALGKHIILSGTDSLGFMFAKADELYNRTYMIHTSYISFKEYNYLLNKDLNEYMRYGGTLTDGEIFYNNDTLNEYTNTAIVKNITHSLEYLNNGRSYGALSQLYDNGELESAINRVIEMHNRKIMLRVINGMFVSHDAGSLNELLVKSDIDEIEFDDNFIAMLRTYINVKEEHSIKLNKEEVDIITKYLIDIGVLYNIPRTDDYIFIQPGMRYCQLIGFQDSLKDSGIISNYNLVTQNKILEKIASDIKGNLLEDIIFLDLSMNQDMYTVTKYNNMDSLEVDVVLSDYEAQEMSLIEIKLSKEKNINQLKNLLDAKLQGDIQKQYGCKIVNKTCIYMGEDYFDAENDVEYFNAGKFLADKDKYLLRMFNKNISLRLEETSVKEVTENIIKGKSR